MSLIHIKLKVYQRELQITSNQGVKSMRYRKLEKFILITIISIVLILGAFIIIRYVREKYMLMSTSPISTVSGTSVQSTDVLVDENGDIGYIHGIWGLGFMNPNESEDNSPYCGVILSSIHYPTIKKLVFGKHAEETVWENAIETPSDFSNPFAGCPQLEEIEVEKGNRHMTAENGMLFHVKGTLIACVPQKEGDVRIPEKVHTLGICALNGCSQIHSLYLPASIESIEDGALGDMKKCVKYVVDNDNKNFCSIDGVIYTSDRKQLVAYPAGKESDSYRIPDGVERVCAGAFMGAENLKKVYFPKSLKSTGVEAFRNCKRLEKVVRVKKLDSLGTGTWNGCKQLKDRPTAGEGA